MKIRLKLLEVKCKSNLNPSKFHLRSVEIELKSSKIEIEFKPITTIGIEFKSIYNQLTSNYKPTNIN